MLHKRLKTTSWNFLLIVMFIVPLPALSIDEFAPSLPNMTSYFNSSNFLMQLTIPIYLIAMAVSQWVFGPLSDRYGRRSTLLLTLLSYLIGGVVCITAHRVDVLLLGRLLQGLGMGCCAMTAPAILADVYEGKALQKASAVLVMVYSLVPILAPVLGGYIQEHIGWRANFVFTTSFTFLSFILTLFFLPETRRIEAVKRLSLTAIIRGNIIVLSTRRYISVVLCMAFAWSLMIAFSVAGPFIVQQGFGYSPSQYGHFALLLGLAFFIGNMVCKNLIEKFDGVQISSYALTFSLVTALIMLLLAKNTDPSVWGIMIPLAFILLFVGIAFPILYSTALSIFSDLIGIASALIGCIMLLGAFLSTLALGAVVGHDIVSLAWVYTVILIVCMFLFRVGTI